MDPIAANRLNWDDRAEIHLRDSTGFYGINAVRAGEKRLDPIVDGELGDVAGLRVAHLQCHFGLDTVRLARRGAIATGLDFSPRAIAGARALGAELGLPVRFVEGNVYDAATLLDGPFDLVYVTWGALCWLPDMTRWARVVAALLAPGGALYLADSHPAMNALDEQDERLVLARPWQVPIDAPFRYNDTTTYTGAPDMLAHSQTYEWAHSFSAILGALLAAGFRLDFLHEHETLPWPAFPMMEPAGAGMFRLPASTPALPLAFSLRATLG
ncbi:bifunctional 2-polyprenyl-6-hydroxyphenol methylase/3-demethylubiquinol 3-O-methyltransferase UbiG [Falsiroseomonas sp.]|uniref:class I SAM-dependent methyltransferase n=1 Tax=Falsiroseomonas sp. TaxID=2870721 RepID=UPI002732A0C7|nr:class I SAM-dependent methyltransferase [Falsiroseomonas sp.]MDP3415954.1 class I SAM-dependent methyltransferase [Falsiroseomonas sp.]